LLPAALAPAWRAAADSPPAEPDPDVGADDPLTMSFLRRYTPQGGEIDVHAVWGRGPGFTSYLISYPSEGLRITGFMNVPDGSGPFPIVACNHGYINPAVYRTGQGSKREADYLAARGYLTVSSDYRGHGGSEGQPDGGHLDTGYARDVINLIASAQRHPKADAGRVGVWGHSMGGNLAYKLMVTRSEVRATVVFAGVSASAVDDFYYLAQMIRRPLAELVQRFNVPEADPERYARMSPITYLRWMAGPVQLHHGTADANVPYWHTQQLVQALATAGVPYEFYSYPGAPHTFSGATWELAMRRTVAFFDRYLKGAS
jgi:dipeptidyl aminopeptidase/acylaminoacyl peptidase